MGRTCSGGGLTTLALILAIIPSLPWARAPTAAAISYTPFDENAQCGSSPCTTAEVTAVVFRAQSFVASDGYNLTRIGLTINLTSPMSPGPLTLTVHRDSGSIAAATGRESVRAPSAVRLN